MAVFEVSFDAALFRREANQKIKRQIPFAFSLALNETIEDIREELIDDLPESFTIRSDWTKKGIRTKRSTKKNLVAVVGSKDSYMAEQVSGGTRQKKQAVPIQARPRETSKTPRSKWPKALIARKGGFIADFGSGPAVYVPSRHRDPRQRRLRLMYRLVDEIKIPKRWPLETIFRRVVGRDWAKNVTRALKRALRSRRR
jgi:hypothetical protein